MYIAFDQLPPHARLWVYQTSSPLSEKEDRLTTETLLQFTQSWEAHQQPLKASYQILHGHFIILAVDGSFHEASGCSIDSSVRVMRDLEAKIGRPLMDRSLVAFQLEGKVSWFRLPELKQKFHDGALNGDVLTFNTLASTKAELGNGWVPVQGTWLKKYMEKRVLAS